MGQDIRPEGLPDTQNETQEDPGEHQSPAKDLALIAQHNHHDGLRERPLSGEVWTEGEDRDESSQQDQNGGHPGPKYPDSREVLANALIEFRGHSQAKDK